MLNYQKSQMEFGMLIASSRVAISEGKYNSVLFIFYYVIENNSWICQNMVLFQVLNNIVNK